MTLVSLGDYETDYSYTGEMSDQSGLINLRARYYDPGMGRFVSRDTWAGDYKNPITLNKWLYSHGNPILLTDPSGNDPWWCGNDMDCYAKWIANYQINSCLSSTPRPTPTLTPTPTPTPTPIDPIISKQLILDQFGIQMTESNDRVWKINNLRTAYRALSMIDNKTNGHLWS